MDLLNYLEELIKEHKKLDPDNKKAQELEVEIENCKDYLMEHGQ